MHDGDYEHGETLWFSSTPPPPTTMPTTTFSPEYNTHGVTTTASPTTYGCWHCDATNWESCFLIGEYKTCAEAQVCMMEIRERNGMTFSVCSMCKDKDACHTQRANNFGNRGAQCRPRTPSGPSCCRQCCEFDRCLITLIQKPNGDGKRDQSKDGTILMEKIKDWFRRHVKTPMRPPQLKQ